jgi:hypothetical protein
MEETTSPIEPISRHSKYERCLEIIANSPMPDGYDPIPEIGNVEDEEGQWQEMYDRVKSGKWTPKQGGDYMWYVRSYWFLEKHVPDWRTLAGIIPGKRIVR